MICQVLVNRKDCSVSAKGLIMSRKFSPKAPVYLLTHCIILKMLFFVFVQIFAIDLFTVSVIFFHRVNLISFVTLIKILNALQIAGS